MADKKQMQELNKLLGLLNKNIAKMQDSFLGMQGAITSMASSFDSVNKNAKKTEKSIKGITKATKKLNKEAGSAKISLSDLFKTSAQDSAESFKTMETGVQKAFDAFEKNYARGFSATQSLKNASRDLAKTNSKLSIGLGAVAGGIKGAAKGFQIGTSILSTAVNVILSLVSAVGSLAKAVLLFPIRSLDMLSRYANEAAQAFIPFRQAREDIVKDYGEMVDTFYSAMDGAGKAAQGAYKYFTPERIQMFTEAARDMGDMFFAVSDKFKKSGAAIEDLKRKFRFTGEQMKNVALTVITTGASFDKIRDDIALFANAASESTGIAQKVIAKSIGDIIGDVENFGNITIESAAMISGRMKSLGSDFKTLGGIINKFMNFEDAAQSAAKLGQVFGVNIDAIKMMKSANGDQIQTLEHLRKQMFAAGKSAEKMSTAELRLLAQSTGLNAAQAKLLFSMKNRGKSMSSLKKGMDSAKSSEERQIEAMEKMAKTMDKVVEVLTAPGIFENFIKGFGMGVKENGKFLSTIEKINAAVLDLGKVFGRVFTAVFGKGGAIGAAFGGIDGLAGKIEMFSKKIGGDKGILASVMNFDSKGMDGMFKAFEESFGVDLEGFIVKYVNTAGMLFAKFLPQLASFIAPAIQALADVLLGSDMGKGMDKRFGPLGKSLAKSFKQTFRILKGPINDLMSGLIKQMKEFVKNNKEEINQVGGIIMLTLFGPAAIGAAIGTLTGALTSALMGSIAKIGVKETAKVFGSKLTSIFRFIAKPFKWLGSTIMKVLRPIGSFAMKILRPVFNIFSKGFGMIRSGIKFFSGTASKLMAVFTFILAGIDTFFDIKDAISSGAVELQSFGDYVQAIFGGLLQFAGRVADVLTFGFFTDSFDGMFEGFMNIDFAFSDLMSTFEMGMSESGPIGKFFYWLGGSLVSIVGGIYDVIAGIVRIVWNGITAIGRFFTGDFVGALEDVGDMFDGLMTVFSGIYDAIVYPFAAAWNTIFGNTIWGFDEIYEAIMTFIQPFIDQASFIIGLVTAPFEAAWGFFSDLWNGKSIGEAFSKVIQGIKDKAGEIWDAVTSPFSSAYDYVFGNTIWGKDETKDAMKNVEAGVEEGGFSISSIFTSIFGDGPLTILDTLMTTMESVFESIGKKFSSIFTSITGVDLSTIGKTVETFSSPFTMLRNQARIAGDAVSATLKEMTNINNLLTTETPGAVRAILDGFGENGEAVFKIVHDHQTAAVNVEVHLSSEQIAKGIVRSKEYGSATRNVLEVGR